MSLVGRPPNHPFLNAVRGNPGKRRRRRPPPSAPPPPAEQRSPPADLTGRAREIWHRDAPTLLILKPAHRPSFARRCQLVAVGDLYWTVEEARLERLQARQGSRRSGLRPSPAYWAAIKAWDKAGAIEARFGMTPVDEVRLQPEPVREPDDNPLETLRQRRTHLRPA